MEERTVLVSKKDLVITWFNGGGGAGGQYKNRHNNCCRIHHPGSGATGVGTKERSAEQNKKLAFTALCQDPKMKVWLSRKIYELQTGLTLEQRVDKSLERKNLKIEGIDEFGQWVEID
jgi:protein subunit release factor A